MRAAWAPLCAAKEYRSALRRANYSIKMKCLGLKLAGQGEVARNIATRWRVSFFLYSRRRLCL